MRKVFKSGRSALVITIPKEVAEKMDIKQGDELVVAVVKPEGEVEKWAMAAKLAQSLE